MTNDACLLAGRNGDLRLSSSDRDPGSASITADPSVAATAALWNYHAALTHPKKTPPGARDQTVSCVPCSVQAMPVCSWCVSPLTVLFTFQSPVMLDRASLGHDSASVHDETSSSGNKDDEDDDDEESDDRLDAHKYDPERLKAFNVSLSFIMESIEFV